MHQLWQLLFKSILVNDPKCSKVRWVFIPLQAVETYDMVAVVQSPEHYLSISVLSGHSVAV